MKLSEAFSTIHASIQTIILSKFKEVNHFANCDEFTLCYNCFSKNYIEIRFTTARKLSCGKVMFLHLSVILFTGEGGAVQEGTNIFNKC